MRHDGRTTGFTVSVTQHPGAGPSPYWQGRRELRADLRSSAWLLVALAAAGLPAGVLWWLLAPRADFRITPDGPIVLGDPVDELLIADDAVFALVMAGVGLVCGGAAWWLRRRRGVATVLALGLGGGLASVVAWQLGELLGAGPSEAELARVGGVVTTSLTLGSLPALAIASFTAVLAYLVGVLHAADDGIGRDAGQPRATSDLPGPEPRPWPVEGNRTLAVRPEG